MEVDGRIKAYKFVAYSAISFSAVAVLSICVTLPMVYDYVHEVRRQMHTEISLCKVILPNIHTYNFFFPVYLIPFRLILQIFSLYRHKVYLILQKIFVFFFAAYRHPSYYDRYLTELKN